jgi:hypothetical protein
MAKLVTCADVSSAPRVVVFFEAKRGRMSIVQSMHPAYVKNTSYTLTLPINYPKLVSAHAQICFLGAGDDGGTRKARNAHA